jgi:transposase
MSTPAPTPGHEDLAALHAQVRRYESELAERDAVIAERDAMIEQLQEQVRLLLAQRFAPSSEKMPDGQLGLFNEAEASAGEEESESVPDTEVAAYRRGRPKRAPLPAYLPRVDIVHRLAESERTCPHHAVELERFGEVVSEQLDIIPAKVRVLRHIRAKYRCPRCEGHLRTAPMPAQPLPKSFASPGLLSFIATVVSRFISWGHPAI